MCVCLCVWRGGGRASVSPSFSLCAAECHFLSLSLSLSLFHILSFASLPVRAYERLGGAARLRLLHDLCCEAMEVM